MTYQETLAWLFAQLPMYQNKGVRAFKGKLDNIISFSEYLDNPHEKFKSIHVAGTNGKGSSSHMMASILQEAGYKTGLYTSPHLRDFRERIKVNGKKVSEGFVIDFVAINRPFLEQNQLSFFEMTVAMAFQYFAEQKVDIAVVEVGLGGRLDSTNIIKPEVCLITNIGFDHMSVLGNTLEKIALEKAGIIKRNIPVVISERQHETEMIFKLIATQKGAPISFADEWQQPGYQTDLQGLYQAKNSRGAVACLHQLKDFRIDEPHIQLGLQNTVQNTGILGRWQVLGENPRIVCDTAHNREGLTTVLKQLDRQPFENLHMVIGFVKDKEVKNLLQLFPKKAKYYFVKPDVPRGLDAEILRASAEKLGLHGTEYASVQKGLKKAKSKAGPNDFIFIGGSTFVVAEVV